MARVARRPASETPADPEDDGRESLKRTTVDDEEDAQHAPDDAASKAPARKPLGAVTSTPEQRREARGARVDESTGVGPGVFPTGDEGDVVTAISAECLYTPKQYCSFRVGPFTVQTKVRAGETSADAMRRAQKAVDKLHDEAFEATLAKFVSEQRKAEGAMR